MKHLKPFFEGHLDKYYREATNEEFSEINGININDETYGKIEVQIDKDIWKVDRNDCINPEEEGLDGLEFYSMMISPKDMADYYSGKKPKIEVIESDDEWFWVSIFPGGKDILEEFYKCDQYEGLKKLLKDKNII